MRMYMAVTADRYELYIAQAPSMTELAERLGVNVSQISRKMLQCRGSRNDLDRTKKKAKYFVREVEFGDED